MRNALMGAVLALVPALMPGCASILCGSGPLQRELRATEAELHTLQGNLARGYAVHVSHSIRSQPYTATEYRCAAHSRWGICMQYEPYTVTRYLQVPHSVETPVAIDVDATRERVARLQGGMGALRTAAAQEHAMCVARHGG